LRKYLKFVALCLFAGLALWWFGRGMDWAEAFAATCVGFGAIFLLGRMGEIVRPAFLPLRDRAVKPGAAFVTIALERVCDTAAVILLFAANLLFLRLPGADEATFARVREAGLILFACAVVGLGVLVWFGRNADGVTSRLDAWLGRLPRSLRRVGGIVCGLLEQLGRTLSVLAGGRALLATAGWTALLWATITLANMLVLRAFGIGVGTSETVFVLGWSLVGSVVPTPGAGAGTYHAATATGLMRYLGFPASEVQPAVIILHLVVFGSPLFFGLYYFVRSGFSVARLRELVEAEKAEAEAESNGDAGPAGAASAAAPEASLKASA
jgi:uncharacterized membrane protein YbhN (UPF0104 family)